MRNTNNWHAVRGFRKCCIFKMAPQLLRGIKESWHQQSGIKSQLCPWILRWPQASLRTQRWGHLPQGAVVLNERPVNTPSARRSTGGRLSMASSSHWCIINNCVWFGSHQHFTLSMCYCLVVVWASGSAQRRGASCRPGRLCPSVGGTRVSCRGSWSGIMSACIQQRRSSFGQAGTPWGGLFYSLSLHLSTPKLFLTDGCLACSWKKIPHPVWGSACWV